MENLNERVLNERVVAQARSWLGTRFHHQGRLKKTAAHAGGVDCLGLLIGVARELDLRREDGTPLAALDAPDYGHLPSGEALRAALDASLRAVPFPSSLAAIPLGGILLLAPGGVARHLAIFSGGDPPAMIHAYAQARKVVEHAVDAGWARAIAGVYSLR